MISKLELLQLCNIAKNAGDEILRIYNNNDVNISVKPDDTPVTDADIASHNEIVKGLTSNFSQFPIMSEEANIADWEQRKLWQTYWLIDPLDGTKEFIAKNGEFTVNIALIHEGQPIAGVVYAPALNKNFYGARNIGAWVETEGDIQTLPVNTQSNQHLTVVGSRSHPSPQLQEYLTQFDDYQLTSVGSSLKFCLLAEGIADLYPRLGPTHEWDTAAGQAVLEAAGGKVTEFNSTTPLRCNQKPSTLNPFFLATAKDIELK